MTLRPVGPQDPPVIAQWAAEIASDAFMSRTSPRNPGARCHDPGQGLFWYLILEGSLPVGTVWIERLDFESSALLGIFLGDRGYFGRGIGRSAIAQAVAAFRNACPGVGLSLHVRHSNLRAIACYQRAGFVIVDSQVKTSVSGRSIPYFRMAWGQVCSG